MKRKEEKKKRKKRGRGPAYIPPGMRLNWKSPDENTYS
jgi:hypothetical protein